MKKVILIVILLTAFIVKAKSQEEIKLYPNGPTESNEITVAESSYNSEFFINISEPRMYAYPAPKAIANGTAVVICPGGGYGGVFVSREGTDFALWLNKLGISAFVLYYRVPNGHNKIPLKDAQTAMKIVRERAVEWNINVNKIGIVGFSAGGHLASTVGTHFKNKKQRPAFMILGYPVITMDTMYSHMDSRERLIGKNPTAEMVKLYSNELQVTKKTPPTFMVHALDDKDVSIANSENFLKALKAKKVTAELLKFDQGGHGFNMKKQGLPVDNWTDSLIVWLKINKWID